MLCSDSDPKLEGFCEVARTNLRLKKVLIEDAPEYQSEEIETISQRKEGTQLDRYLYILMIRDFNPRSYFEALESFLIDYPESPISLYLKLQNKIPISGFLPYDSLPEFAEFLWRNGTALIDNKDFSEGLRSIQMAVELIPNHTEAMKQLGSTYLYTLEHFQRAFEYYNQAVEIDPLDIAALLGKAISLHYLGENLESNRVLDRMFDWDTARWKAVPKDQLPYYKGQGFYFRAYNFYLTGSKTTARELVDKALVSQPDDDGPHYLSGVLHFENQEFDSAESEFLQVINQGTTLCDSYFRLGKIECSRDSTKSLEFFRTNKSCLEKTIQRFDDAIDDLLTLNLDKKTKLEIRETLRQRRKNIVNQAVASAFNMLTSAQKLSGPESKEFVVSIESFWQKLSDQGNPDPINTPD